MSKSDFDGLNSDDADARLTHEGLSHEGFAERTLGESHYFSDKVSWGKVILGTLVLITSLGGAAYWAGGRNASGEQARKDAVMQTHAALAPNIELEEVARERVRQEATVVVPPLVTVAPSPADVLRRARPRASVSFFEPIEGQAVGSTMQVRGMAKNVPAGRHLWLVTSREPNVGFWPKERIELSNDGIFEMQVWDFGDEGAFSICLLSTDAVETQRFESWLNAGDRDDRWPALARDRTRSVTLGCQEVKLDRRLDD